METTEPNTAWLAVLNTVLASLATILCYVGICQEELDALDESKIIIIDEDDDEDLDNEEEKHLYVRQDLRNAENLLNYRAYCCYAQDDAIIDTDMTNSRDRVFKWPQSEEILDSVRDTHAKTSLALSQHTTDIIHALGISRARVCDQRLDQSVRLSERARQSGRVLAKKDVRLCWDHFMSMARPGLGQQNKTKKSKNKNFNNSSKTYHHNFHSIVTRSF